MRALTRARAVAFPARAARVTARPGSRRRVAARAGPKNRLREKEARKARETRDHDAEFDDYVNKHVDRPPAGATEGARRPAKTSEAKRFVKKVRRKAKKAAQKAVDALLPRESAFPRSSSDAPVRMGAASGGMMTHRPYRPNPYGAYGRAAAAWGAIFACAWVALKIVNGENPVRKIGGAIGGVFKGGSRPPPPGARGPGRWVGDRSLGGRQVWVPASEDRYREERRRLEGALDELPGDASRPRASVQAPASSSDAAKKSEADLPAWWVQPSPQYVPPGRKESLILSARTEGANLARKRVNGSGISPEDLADFRSACAAAGERGCAAKSVGPEGARVAIFRAAADYAVTDAMSGRAGATSSFNAPVGQFLVGLSDDLNLEPRKCVSVVMADVAVRVRGAVVQAGAGIRTNDTVSTMLELDKLVQLFNAFPFADDAPELDMLSVGLRSRLTDVERDAICREYDSVSGGAHSAVFRAAVRGSTSSAYE